MSTGIIIALIILGIVLLLIEFLVIPGITVAGIAGTLLIVGGVVSGYYFHKPPVSNYISVGTVLFIVIITGIAFKTKTWQKFGLQSTVVGHAPALEQDKFKIGDTGSTVSKLSPIGKVLINDEIIEARSMGNYVDSNTQVVIVRIEKNKIFVEPKN
ncbi:MAG: NfeD family protein [Bacteroidales bacterium]|nr:NfeD family protein [Bacteroidales bacterium]MBN2819968.1 NfeD family protein [Bacteroidales bacterium]